MHVFSGSSHVSVRPDYSPSEEYKGGKTIMVPLCQNKEL
jgi:hypothetical protein